MEKAKVNEVYKVRGQNEDFVKSGAKVTNSYDFRN